MAEYYPLLAKAVGSLPNSTPESRRVVYERARKALIGQLRTLHPPVPNEDIDRESVKLDRAIARIEDELAGSAPPPTADIEPPKTTSAGEGSSAKPPPSTQKPIPAPRPAAPVRADGGALGPPAAKPSAPLRTKLPTPKPAEPVAKSSESLLPPGAALEPVAEVNAPPVVDDIGRPPPPEGRARLDVQRPIAPQPPGAKGPKRQMWIMWTGIGAVVVLMVGAAAWKLRDHPETIARTKPTEQQAKGDAGKSSERVGDTPAASQSAPETPTAPSVAPPNTAAAPQAAPSGAVQPAAPAPASSNPEVPVAQRAALLVEAPEEPNKVKTFLGNVVWKLNNASDGAGDAAGVGVEADVDLPDDKMKAVVTFEKNTDSSLPASHTIKVRFVVQPGSATGDVKQISVPQLRKEDSPSGDPLAGVTVPVIQNSFLVGLSPGNAETANMDLLRTLQWIDVPMLLTSGKIAKLTFEKGASGDRDLNDAIAAWQKQ